MYLNAAMAVSFIPSWKLSCIMCQSKVAHGDEGGNLDLKWNRMCQGVDVN